MCHVQFGGTFDHRLDGVGVEGVEFVGVFRDEFKKLGVLDERDFERFDETDFAGVAGLGGEQIDVVHDGPWHGEGAGEVFLPEEIDAVFHTDAGIALRECGGGKADEANAAMGGSSAEPDGIEKCATADTEDVGMSVDVVDVDQTVDLIDQSGGIFYVLTALKSEDGGLRRQVVETGLCPGNELGIACCDLLFDDTENALGGDVRGVDRLEKYAVIRMENVPRKECAVTEGQRNGKLKHWKKIEVLLGGWLAPMTKETT